MKAMEIYKQEIKKQKDPNEKREVSRRCLRDMKQRKALVDDPAEINVPPSSSPIRGIKTKNHRRRKICLNPNGARELKEQWYQNMIDYIQADLEHLDSLGKGKQELEKCTKEPDTDIDSLIIGKDKPMWLISKEAASELVKNLGIFKGNVKDILEKYFSFKDEAETSEAIENEPKIINGRPSPIGYLPEVIHQLSKNRLLALGEYTEHKYAFVKDFFNYPGRADTDLYKYHMKLGKKHKEEIEKIITSYLPK